MDSMLDPGVSLSERVVKEGLEHIHACGKAAVRGGAGIKFFQQGAECFCLVLGQYGKKFVCRVLFPLGFGLVAVRVIGKSVACIDFD